MSVTSPVRSLLAGAALVGAGVTLCGCSGGGKTTAAPTPAPTPAPGPVAVAWQNHFDAFAAGARQEGDSALTKIMQDYDEDSVIAVFNDDCAGRFGQDPVTSRNGYTEYSDPAAIRQFFSDLFTQLGSLEAVTDIGPNGGPVVMEGDKPNGNVFLTWKAAGKSIARATDSFSWQIKDGAAKIWKQNIVVSEGSTKCPNRQPAAVACDTAPEPKPKMCAAWDNHFDAFGKGVNAADQAATDAALTQIMADYDDRSVVQVWDTEKEEYEEFSTTEGIKNMFNTLFTNIKKEGAAPHGLDVGLLEVEPDFDGVFLVWKTDSHPKATDTFVFDRETGIIVRQNIVVQTKASSSLTAVQV